jgi:hypothetical protein
MRKAGVPLRHRPYRLETPDNHERSFYVDSLAADSLERNSAGARPYEAIQ